MSQSTAIITGAANGIGREIALRLTAAKFGVIAVDLDVSGLESLSEIATGQDHDIEIFDLDCRDSDAIDDFIRNRFVDGETIDLLVNNAGAGLEKPFFEVTLAEWKSVLDLDLTGPFLMTRACWPHFTKPGASVVNISSVHALRALPGLAAYAAAKGGLNSLTRAMALDAGKYGVRVNAIMPGFTWTTRWEEQLRNAGGMVAEEQDDIRKVVPLGRLADPSDIAGAVLWLANPESSYVTGAAIEVDGGLLSLAYRLSSSR